MNELEAQLLGGAIVATVIVAVLGWVIIRIINVFLSNYAWEAGKKSHKYRGILK